MPRRRPRQSRLRRPPTTRAERHETLRPVDQAARLRGGDQPAAGRAGRDVVPAPDAARTAEHRPAHRIGGGQLSRRVRGRGGDAHHPDPRGRLVRHRGHQDHPVEQPQRPLRRDHRVQPQPRHRGRRQRCARPRQSGDGPHARRGRPAGDLQGRSRRGRDHLAEHAFHRDGHDGADRLRRPLRAGPPVRAGRRGAGTAGRRPALRDAHLAGPRSDGGARHHHR